MGNKKYLKQISSFKKLIEEHRNKITTEEAKNNPDLRLLNYWEKEIDKFKKELTKSEKRMKRR
jgi:peptidoglycan hydrolase CwlO-like protein